MATKFERADAWRAMEMEERAYWACRGPAERSAALLSLTTELLAVQRQSDHAQVVAADEHRRAEKLRAWLALKERLRCPDVSQPSSKTSSAAR